MSISWGCVHMHVFVGLLTWFDLHCAPPLAALSFAVSYSQDEAVFALHQVSKKQHCLVVGAVQHILLNKTKQKNNTFLFISKSHGPCNKLNQN